MQGVKCPSRGVGGGQGRVKLGLLTVDASVVGANLWVGPCLVRTGR